MSEKQKVTFMDCVFTAAAIPELVDNFNRLTGCTLGCSIPKTPLEAIIDRATGYDNKLSDEEKANIVAFIDFVYEFVWCRLPEEVRA